MKLSKKQEAELMEVYNTWWDSYLNGDVKTYDSFLEDDFRFVGSTGHEEFLNREDATAFLEDTAEQLAGKTRRENSIITLEPMEGMVLITDLADAYVKSDSEWVYYARFRFTSMMRNTKNGWRFFYQHFSTPDLKAQEGETIGTQKITAENLELKSAIKRRTAELEIKNRALEIEVSLESIRAQATAMQQSADLLDIVVTMRNAFTKLGHKADYFWHMMYLPDKYEKAMTSGDGSQIGMVMELPRDFHSHYEGMSEWEAGDEPIMILPLEVDDAVDYVDKMIRLGNFQKVDPNAPTLDDIRHIGGITFIMARTSHGEIGYSLPGVVKNPPEADLRILERFAGAFDLAHRRFLDLQKAEEQAREVEIELALEKVRSRSIGMQKSEELREVIQVIHDQLIDLSFEIDAAGFTLDYHQNNDWNTWIANKSGSLPSLMHIPYIDHPQFNYYKNAKEKGLDFLANTLSFEDKNSIFKYMFKFMGDYPQAEKNELLSKPGLAISQAFLDNISLWIYNLDAIPYSDEDNKTLMRFAKVFEQTYIRFNDLKQAEAQAREAQVEAALERVRARTMAMQRSDELLEVATVMFQQVKALGVSQWNCGFNIWEAGDQEFTYYPGSPDGKIIPFTCKIPLNEHPVFKRFDESKKRGEKLLIYEKKGKEQKDHYDYMLSLPGVGDFLRSMMDADFELPELQIDHVANFAYGNLIFITYEHFPEMHNVFERFAKVFEQTYTRFLDLQKAEAQAREAQIEAALERVRSRTMGMINSNELSAVASMLFNQITELNIAVWTAGFNVWSEDDKEYEDWITSPKGGFIEPYKVDTTQFRVFIEVREAKQRGDDFFVQYVEGENLKKMYAELSKFAPQQFEVMLQDGFEFPKHQYNHFVFENSVSLMFITYEPLPEAHDIFMRFGKVFQQTYTRFLDLQKAEAQAREANIEGALERVRSRTMGMQQSQELGEVATVLFKELNELVDNLWTCGFVLCEKDRKEDEWWLSTEQGFIPAFYLPNVGDATHHNIYKGWEKGESYHTEQLEGDALQEHYDWLMTIPESKKIFDEMEADGLERPSWQKLHCAYFSYGYLVMITRVPCPEEEIFKRFAKVFDQTYRRFLDLQRAEAQAREAQIEAALERVRSRSMAMHNSEEIGDVAFVLFEQLKSLGGELWGTGFGFCQKDSDVDEFWFANENGILPHLKIPNTEDPAHKQMYKGWKENLEAFSLAKGAKELKEHYKYMLKVPDVKPIFQEMLDNGIQFPDWQKWHAAYFKYGYLLVITTEAYENEAIFKRFAKVFEQAYTRFLDLQKAEAQAREAQIENAMEKVRSRTMAMQKGEELKDVVVLLYKELIGLGVTNFVTCGYVEINEEIKRQITWVTSPGGDSLGLFYLPLTGDATFDDRYAAWQKQLPVFHQKVAGEVRRKHLEYAITTFNSKEAEEMVLGQFPDPTVFYCFNFSHGYLHLVTGSELTNAEEVLLARFTRVFEQTYARFLDLQKAEAQAREAEIEAALERVRSKTMAMHNSQEVGQTVSLMFDELIKLGIDKSVRCGIGILDQKKPMELWTASSDAKGEVVLHIGLLSMSIHPLLKGVKKSWMDKKPVFNYELKGKNLIKYFKALNEFPDYPFYTALESLPKSVVHNSFIFSEGILYAFSPAQLSSEEEQIFKRFASVFDQTYRRYLDLQKAEAQAREAQIEAALERVRSRSMAMHKSEELKEVIQEVYEQFVSLNIHIEHTGFIMDYKVNDDMHIWLADRHEIQSEIKFPYFDCDYWNSFNEAKQKGLDFFVTRLNYEEKNKFYGDLFKLISDVPEESIESYLSYEGLAASTVLMENVGLYIENFSGIPYTDDENAILKRFGKVFQQTYTRFLDLQKAEAQAREAEIEAALERVRSKTMAMHNSEDVGHTVISLFDEVMKLGLDNSIRCGIGILENRTHMETWSANLKEDGDVVLRVGLLNMQIHPMLRGLKKAWEKGKEGYSYDFIGDDVHRYYKALNSEPEYPFNADLENLPEKEYHNSFFFSSGILFAFSENPFSEETAKVLDRFSDVFGQTYRRYLDLQKAEEQAREAQIEASLEKVRSRTMAMQSSNELTEAANVLFNEVRGLGINAWSAGYNVLSEDKTQSKCWMSSEDQLQDPFPLYFTEEASFIEMGNFFRSEEDFFVQELGGEDLIQHYDYMKSVPELFETFKNLEKAGLSLPTYQINHLCKFSQGFLLFITYEKVPESHDIFKRFTKVFEQTYTRFLDLQKAEAQAREAEIERSLERVRAQTMAMNKSEDLQISVSVIFKELDRLDLRTLRCGIGIINEKNKTGNIWTTTATNDGGDLSFTGDESMDAHPVLQAAFSAWKKQEDLFYELKGEDLVSYYAAMGIDDYTIPDGAMGSSVSVDDRQYYFATFFSEGGLFLFSEDPFTDELVNVIKRFTKAFSLAYKRFQDLKQAENQSKEAQIELALERVRASTMAMHRSEQLAETAEVLFEQFDLLGVTPDRISIAIFNEKKRVFELWATDQKGSNVNHVHYFSIDEPTCTSKIYKAWKDEKETFIVDLKGKELKDWVRYVQEEAKMKLDESKFKGRRVQNCAFFSQGFLLLSSHVPISKEILQLLLRFTKVFQQTYTRFLDLQKAEAQARDAIKHASVDRVRAEIASMRTTNDLNRITPLVWNELTTLNVPFIRCGVFIMDEEKQQVQTHLSTPDGKAIASFHLPFENTEPLTELLPYWRKKEMFREHWDESAFVKSTKILMERGAIASSESYVTENRPTNLYLHFLPFLQGMLYVGSEVPLSEDELSLAQNLAEAFSTAYSRYEDFNKLELANKKIEKTLVDLKQTQTQLIQSEKMASLGELTAGIAHEIQNPLNFVNNFSEVSHELMKEMQEEIEKGDLSEALDIGTDIEQNLEKINHHGKRASDIVKGMLQHSRSNSGEREPTDLNALIDEYLRLAYHGLRAKDKSFNVKMDTQFEPDLEKVNIVPQDMGRVILNLITNAFYVVDEKKKSGAENYEPTVFVGTKKNKGSIEIIVKDNGNGIPKKVLDKIFQPFFTTKPTGKGTGLGLSLSYDIVKAHGGEIKVDTTDNKGTEFIINLPVN